MEGRCREFSGQGSPGRVMQEPCDPGVAIGAEVACNPREVTLP